jgi:hypothetical protein
MIDVSVTPIIMCHPARNGLLADVILPAWMPARPYQVYDPDPDGPRECYRTGRVAWRVAAEATTTHVLVCTDDALPCRNFMEAVYEVVSVMPAEVVSLYSARRAVTDAEAAGKHWARIPARDWINDHALLMPTPFAAEMISWVEQGHDSEWGTYMDTRIRSWLIDQGLSVWLTAPSLVQHHQPSDSLVGNNDPRRVAASWVGREANPLEIDWTKGLP